MARSTTPASPESVVWTDEEKRYLRAVLSHDFLGSSEEIRRALTARRLNNSASKLKNHKAPVGEFRVLVIGAKGTGKTSLLTRICKGRFPNPDESHDALLDQGCRHTTEIDSETYTVDALELPSKHLWRDDLVQQAVNITEAALLVYSVTDPASLRLALGLQELVRDTAAASGREYALVLVGNKSDAPAGPLTPEQQRAAYDEGADLAEIQERRRIAYSEGKRACDGFQVRSSFMEVSARTGDQVGLLFPKVGKEILTLRGINRERKEYAEKMEKLKQEAAAGPSAQPKRKVGLWRRISRPFFLRREVV